MLGNNPKLPRLNGSGDRLDSNWDVFCKPVLAQKEVRPELLFRWIPSLNLCECR